MNFCFYISGNSARLKKFLLNCRCDYTITNDDHYFVVSEYNIEEDLLGIIKERRIKYEVIPYSDLDTYNVRNIELSDRMLAFFLSNHIDYCFSFGSHILMGELLKQYSFRLINFHPAILPMYPGINAIDQAERHGNTLLVGNTAHFIDEGVDTGPIIMQSVIPIKVFEESKDYDKVLDLQIPMLEKIILLLKENRIKVIDNKVLIEGADYNKSACFPYIN